MKTMKIAVFGSLLVIFGVVLISAHLVAAEDASSRAHTPKPGSAERKAILDALRAWFKKSSTVDVVFVVRHMKVKNGYVWVHTMPQSKDGKNMYEDMSALLKKEKDHWEVIEIPCVEEENPKRIGDPGYFDGLKKRFPEMPEEILPGREK